MYRLEIVSNKSVEADIMEALEEYIPDIMYTIIPLAYGRGGENRKMGTTTWPETNMVLVSYLDDSKIETARKVIDAIKNKFPREGVKFFAIKSEN